MVALPSRTDPTSPASISTATFEVARRGYDRDEVASFLRAVANEMSRLRDANARLTDEVEALQAAQAAAAEQPEPEPPQLDEATVASLLGEETARVLTAAREAAAQIKAKAEEGADETRRIAEEDAARLIAEADLEAARRRQEALDARDAELESAKQEGRQMVAEARAVRERMLADLARRRDAARAQLDELRSGRNRLVGAFEAAQRTVDELLRDLRSVVPDTIGTSDLDVELAAAQAPPGLVLGEPPSTPSLSLVPPLDGDATDGSASGAVDVVAVADVIEVAVTDAGADAGAAAVEPAALDDGTAPAAALTYAGEWTGPGPSAPATDADGEAEAGAAHGGEDVGEREPAPEPAPEPAASDPLGVRDAALAPIQTSLARRLKRALADEQNEVLDGLRRAAAGSDLTAVLPAPAEHAERYRATVEDDVWAAALAGARSMAPDASQDADGEAVAASLDRRRVLDATLDDVGADVAAPLRERLAQVLHDAAGDPMEAATALRSVYREWKTQRIDEVADHLVLTAHGRAAFAAVTPGTPITWLVYPGRASCPDCADDGLAGAVPAGEPFPTGHLHAPAHPGCRCSIAEAQG